MKIVSATTPSGIRLERVGDAFVQKGTLASLAFLHDLSAADFAGPSELCEPYLRSPWVMRAIKIITTPITQVDLDFYSDARGGEVELNDPALDAFWQNPGIDRSGPMGRADFLEATIGWLKLAGESFWLLGDDWMVNRLAKTRSPMIVARPDRMRPIFDSLTRALAAWMFTDANGRQWPLAKEQVIHLKFWNPYDDLRGAPEYAAAKVAAEGDYASANFQRNLAARNGDRGQTFTAKNGIPTDEQREQITASLRARQAAARRGDWKDIFLPADIGVEEPKIMSPDAAFVSARLNNRHEIAIAFGVPPSMFDVKASYSIGSASDQYALIANTCIPLANGKLADGIERVSTLFTPGRPRICAAFDFDDHPVMQQVRSERIETMGKLLDRGVPLRTASDYLGLGLPPTPGDEIGHLPFNLQEIGAPMKDPATDPALGEPEPPAPDAIELMVKALEDGPVARMQAALALGARTERMKDEGERMKKSDSEISLPPSAFRLSPARQALWERHMRGRAKTVKMYRAKFTKVLMEARAETLAKIAKFDLRSCSEKSNNSISTRDGAAALFTFDLAHFRQNLLAEMRKAGATALQTAGDELMAEVHEPTPFDLAPDTVHSYLAERDNKLTDVADSTYERIKASLAEGFDAGESTAKLSARIRREFNEIDSERADVIAQTETSAAYGVGRARAMEQAGVEFKQWLTSGNANVRQTHRELEGKVEPLLEAFDLSDGDHLQNPGDPNGLPENVINCHCVCIAVKSMADEFESEEEG